MGLNKTQSQLLFVIVIMMVTVTGVGLFILFSNLTMPPKVIVDDLFDDDTFAQDSNANGELGISTNLKDPQGTIIRSTEPDPYSNQFSITDPQTNEEVAFYSQSLTYKCWGKNIDFDTLQIVGEWVFTQYIGVDGAGETFPYDIGNVLGIVSTTEFPDVSINADGYDEVSGELSFTDISLNDILPDVIIVSNADGAGDVTETEYNQKTSWSHPMTFVFDTEYTIEVEDVYGNLYSDTYNVHIALTLIWSGSDFQVEWNPNTDTSYEETQPPTTSEPVKVEPTDEPDYTYTQKDLLSEESITVTKDTDIDAYALNLSGYTVSIVAIAGLLCVLVPVMGFWYIKRK